MEFDLSDEQAMLQDSVHRFLLDAGGLERKAWLLRHEGVNLPV